MWFDSELKEALIQSEIANNIYETSGSVEDLNTFKEKKKVLKI